MWLYIHEREPTFVRIGKDEVSEIVTHHCHISNSFFWWNMFTLFKRLFQQDYNSESIASVDRLLLIKCLTFSKQSFDYFALIILSTKKSKHCVMLTRGSRRSTPISSVVFKQLQRMCHLD